MPKVSRSGVPKRCALTSSQLGIPEIWRYTKKGLTISQLQNGDYVEREFSPTFAMISPDVIAQFLQLRETTDDNAVIRALRTWLREQINQG